MRVRLLTAVRARSEVSLQKKESQVELWDESERAEAHLRHQRMVITFSARSNTSFLLAISSASFLTSTGAAEKILSRVPEICIEREGLKISFDDWRSGEERRGKGSSPGR